MTGFVSRELRRRGRPITTQAAYDQAHAGELRGIGMDLMWFDELEDSTDVLPVKQYGLLRAISAHRLALIDLLALIVPLLLAYLLWR